MIHPDPEGESAEVVDAAWRLFVSDSMKQAPEVM
jgi:hypothetical protein